LLKVIRQNAWAGGVRDRTRPPRFEGSLRATFTMRMIVAIIRPDKLEAVKESLDPSEFSMIVSEVKVREAREKVTQIYRGIKYSRDLLPKLRVNIRVNDEDLGNVAAIIAKAARVREIAGSRIFATPVEEL
jgi:nitrogen regulatory protein P-II 1